MKINDLTKNILKSVKTVLSFRDLCNLCSFLDLSSAGIKRIVQDRLDIYIRNQPYSTLVLISNKIYEYSESSKRSNAICSANSFENTLCDFKADTLNDSILSLAPVDLRNEVAVINRNEIVILNFTNYNQTQTTVPTEVIPGAVSRPATVNLPNMLLHTTVQTSPFYCCVVCLHPLSLLIPQFMPSINQNARTTSTSVIQFSLSDSAQKLIAKNILMINNKVDYKWQVLLRFIAIDPILSIQNEKEPISQIIPPFLTVSVNHQPVALWEILPSNTRIKEGKRHPKPVNITDKLNVSNSANNCYRQNITINWWQTPGVFQYYYVGVYLERKLSVQEILQLFVSNKHVNILPIDITLNLVKTKLNDAKYASDDGDNDLVVASVLPIQLSCPIGKCRIQIPLRTLNCQHLQCFDAQIFLSMNERRSIWRCPICDSNATTNELFCDIYFQRILNEFIGNDNVNDINVRVDGSYVPVFPHDDKAQPELNVENGDVFIDHDDKMIILDSEDEEDHPEKVFDFCQSNVQSVSTKDNTPVSINSTILTSETRPEFNLPDNHHLISTKSLQTRNNRPIISIIDKPDKVHISVQSTVGKHIVKCSDNVISTQSLLANSLVNDTNFQTYSVATSPFSALYPPKVRNLHDIPILSSIIAPNYTTPPPIAVNTFLNHKASHNNPKPLVQTQLPTMWNGFNSSPTQVIQAPTFIPMGPASRNSSKSPIKTPVFSQTSFSTIVKSMVNPISSPSFPKVVLSQKLTTIEDEIQVSKSICGPIPTLSFPNEILQHKLKSDDQFSNSKILPSIKDLYSNVPKERNTISNKDVDKQQSCTSVVPTPIATIKENLGLSYKIPSDNSKEFDSDVIKSVPPDMIINKNIIPTPISCPIINPNHYVPTTQPEVSTNCFHTIQDNSSRNSINVSKNASSSVTIPELSIDLTSDDDDECVIYEQTEASEVNYNMKSLGSSYIQGRKSLRMSSININSFSHFKPMLSKKSVMHKTINIHDKRPIDLTGEDEDEDIIIYSATKRSKIHFNDDSSSESSSSDIMNNSPTRMVNNYRVNYDSFKN